MKFLTAAFATSFLAIALACGGGSSSFSMPSASLTEPWSSMSLPIDDGNIVYSESNATTITYSGGSVSSIAGEYESAITGGGWSQTFRDDSSGTITAMYSKDGVTLTLVVMESLGNPMVSLTRS